MNAHVVDLCKFTKVSPMRPRDIGNADLYIILSSWM